MKQNERYKQLKWYLAQDMQAEKIPGTTASRMNLAFLIETLVENPTKFLERYQSRHSWGSEGFAYWRGGIDAHWLLITLASAASAANVSCTA